MSRISIEMTQCKRCGKPIATASRSLYGLDSLKAKYGDICHDCTTPEERDEMVHAIGLGVMRRPQ